VRGFGRVRLPPVGGLISGTLAASGFAAIAVVAYAGMRFEAGPFVQFLLLAAAMAGIWSWCSVRNLDRRLGDAALVVATGTCALLACGIISNAGLRLGAPTVDSWLLRADAVLGIQVETVVRSFARHPAIIAILNWVYNASSLAVVGLIAAQLAGGRRRLVWEMLATIVIAMQVIALCSIATPAIGAMNVTGMMDLQGNGLPAGAGVYHLQAFQHFYAGTDPVLRLSDMNGLVTFPSFHTVLALMATQALAETRWRWLAVGWTAAVIVSTIPIGGHYVIDLVAGFAIWAAAAAIARRVNTPSA
jgi:hypothetical protein